MDIEELFRKTWQQHSTPPPDSVWDKIASQLPLSGTDVPNDNSQISQKTTMTKAAAKSIAKATVWKVGVITATVGIVATIATILLTEPKDVPSEPTAIVHESKDNLNEIYTDTTTYIIDTTISKTESSIKIHHSTSSATLEEKQTTHTVSAEKITVSENKISTDTSQSVSAKENTMQKEAAITPTTTSKQSEEIASAQEAIPQEKISEINTIKTPTAHQIKAKIKLKIPNLITPNNDNINDCWIIGGLEIYNNVHVIILSENRKVVYENKKYDNSWCANDLPDGTYYYTIVITNENYVKRGVLQIITH